MASSHEGDETRDECKVWLQTSVKSLAKAYSGNEPEYSLNLIKESNPDYVRDSISRKGM